MQISKWTKLAYISIFTAIFTGFKSDREMLGGAQEKVKESLDAM